MMRKLLLIAHAFHQKSHSHDFLVRLLEPHYEITLCYIDPEDPKDYRALGVLEDIPFAVVVCWQILPPRRRLRRFQAAKIIFFPMYDHSMSWRIENWFPYRDIRIISFSRVLHQKLVKLGLDSHHFQFFPEPSKEIEWGDPREAFFWNRIAKVPPHTACILLWDSAIRKIHIQRALDPGQVFIPPSEEDQARFLITYSSWSESREDLRGKIEACGVYVAPRLFEGIGLAFLEAMATGRCVIAPDRPTMNEYIVHGQTGYLYDPNKVNSLGSVDVEHVQRQTYAYMREGYTRWVDDKLRILSLLEAPNFENPLRLWGYFFAALVPCFLHILRNSQRWLFSIRIRKHGCSIRFCGRMWGENRQKPMT